MCTIVSNGNGANLRDWFVGTHCAAWTPRAVRVDRWMNVDPPGKTSIGVITRFAYDAWKSAVTCCAANTYGDMTDDGRRKKAE